LRYAKKLEKLGVKFGDIYSAFTSTELGEMLPDDYKTTRKNKTWIAYAAFRGTDIEAATEADARAKMLIYLIENGLYTPDKKSAS
jgi:hypothetical protein